jgi:uncharacterized protein
MPGSFIDTLRDAAVRDLAWVIASPGLLDASHIAYRGHVVDDNWCNTQLLSRASWLTSLDAQPLPLHNFIKARPTRRLGHYFESLIQFWLTHLPDTQLLATNLQVQDEQRTQGEYDFLFRDNGKVYHWEAAVKFYLQVEPRAEQRAFIGPGTRDRLDLKLNKVFQQQLLLSDSAPGQQTLPRGIKPDETQAFIKGYLFYHAATKTRQTIAGVSAAHLPGWWLRYGVDKIAQTAVDSRWAILPRLSWLAPAFITDPALVLTLTILDERLTEHFGSSMEAILISELAAVATGGWKEISRGFVVCSSWPIITPSESSYGANKTP